MDSFIRFISLFLFVTICFSLAVKGDLRCGSNTLLTQNNGEIISHAGYEFGHNYGKNLNCTWTMQAPAGQFVELVAENFSVYGGFSSSNCYGDYVQLFDGDSMKSKSLGKFCGSSFNPISSTTNKLTLQFVTNGYTQYQGFRFFYNFTDHVIHSCPAYLFRCDNGYCLSKSYKCDTDDDCGDDSDEQNCPIVTCSASQFTCNNHKCEPLSWLCDGDNDCGDGSDELSSNCHLYTTTTTHSPAYYCGQMNYTGVTGTIHSLNYPSHYPRMSFCRYQIYAPSWTHSISFAFNSVFGLESNSLCSFDSVKIYSDRHTYTHGPFCGFTAPQSFAIPTNHAIVEFRSDGINNYNGFQLTYSAT